MGHSIQRAERVHLNSVLANALAILGIILGCAPLLDAAAHGVRMLPQVWPM
jgi:hypothetical protein